MINYFSFFVFVKVGIWIENNFLLFWYDIFRHFLLHVQQNLYKLLGTPSYRTFVLQMYQYWNMFIPVNFILFLRYKRRCQVITNQDDIDRAATECLAWSNNVSSRSNVNFVLQSTGRIVTLYLIFVWLFVFCISSNACSENSHDGLQEDLYFRCSVENFRHLDSQQT